MTAWEDDFRPGTAASFLNGDRGSGAARTQGRRPDLQRGFVEQRNSPRGAINEGHMCTSATPELPNDCLCGVTGGAESRIGIVHNVMRYEVLRPGAFSARWVTPVVEWLNRVWATDLTLEYFKSGRFCWHSPWAPTTETQDEVPGLDFVGMNYYGK